MILEPLQYVLGAGSGALVGLVLGLVGGGGSILAVPLMIYVVGVTNPHVAIGTSALAVAATAAINLFDHARAGHVKWRCAHLFASTGILGALAGSTLGMAVDGQKLLCLFALVMVLVGVLMLRARNQCGNPGAECRREQLPRVLGFGGAAGLFSGFFGIGGGFLIVPGLVASTGMPTLYAIGSSLVAVLAFGLTTGINYAWSGLVDWPLALLFIGGGAVGGFMGASFARRLSQRTGALNTLFAVLIFIVAAGMLWQGGLAL